MDGERGSLHTLNGKILKLIVLLQCCGGLLGGGGLIGFGCRGGGLAVFLGL